MSLSYAPSPSFPLVTFSSLKTITNKWQQIFARANNAKHQKRLSSMMDVVAMVPTLPEDSIIVSLPFGGAVLRSLGCTADEVNALLEDTRKKFIVEKGEFLAREQSFV